MTLLITNSVFCQKQKIIIQEYVIDSSGYKIAQFEKIRCRSAGDFCQFILKNSSNEIIIVIYKRYLYFDSLKTKENTAGYGYYLEFVFPDKFLKAQVVCTEKQVIDSEFVKKIVSGLCKVFSGCGHCANNYGLEENALDKFVKQNPAKYLND